MAEENRPVWIVHSAVCHFEVAGSLKVCELLVIDIYLGVALGILHKLKEIYFYRKRVPIDVTCSECLLLPVYACIVRLEAFTS